MQTIIFWLLVAIALLVCAIAGLIIYISGLQAKLKASYASNREIYKGYKGEVEKREKTEQKVSKLSAVITQQNKVIDRLEQYNRKLKSANNDLARVALKKPTTADYKKAIIKDYKAGADVHDIATKYNLKANTVFKAINRRKAKGDIK